MEFKVTISKHTVYNTSHLDVFFETDFGNEKNCITYEIQIEYLQNLMDGLVVNCIKKENHRNLYLNYQGEISGNRGNLKIIWQGFHQIEINCFLENIQIRLERNYIKIS